MLHTHPVFHSYPGSRFIDIQVAVPRMWSQVLYTGHHVFHGYELNGVFACCLHFAVSQLGTRKQQGAVELFHNLYFAALSLIGWQGPLGFHDVKKVQNTL